jgi:type VI secretion system protein ImpI
MIALVVTVTQEGRPGAEQFAFDKSPVRIGRSELNDISLQPPFVSTHHALVQFDDAEAHYLDLGSLNGSLLEGNPIEPNTPALLVPGAEIRIPIVSSEVPQICLSFSRKVISERPAPRQQRTAFQLRASSLELALSAAPAPAATRPGGASAASHSAEATTSAAEAFAAAQVDLDLDYTSYRGAWEYLHAGLKDTISGLEGPASVAALEQMAVRYPSLMAEPQFLDLLGTGAGGAPAGGAVALDGCPSSTGHPSRGPAADALRLLRTFCESYLPVSQGLATGAEIEAVLGRVAATLEAFGCSFIELRNGYEEFGKEMGVQTIQGEGALYRARDARQFLAYVLDPCGAGRDAELQRSFAEFMIHQVALLHGVTEGAKAMLSQLSPETISRAVPRKLWRLRTSALWKAYRARFHEIADEESTVSEALFGNEFARAYAAMAGQPQPAEREPDGGTPNDSDSASPEVTQTRLGSGD